MSQHDIIGAATISADSYDPNNEHHTVTGEGDDAIYQDTRYHVNTLEPIDGADDYIVTPLPSVSRRFAGVPLDEHIFYRFPDEAAYREFVPEPVEEV